MNIEISNRLIELRKKNGYSQEELASKLGLTRQAVSKWERAEASPDTDNLICLAKLYGVSLDQLLSTDEDVETIVKEQVKEETKEPSEEKGDTNFHSSEEKGIHITDSDGSEVHISKSGIFLKDNEDSVKITGEGATINGKDVSIYSFDSKRNRRLRILESILGSICGLGAVVAYLLIGFLLQDQGNSSGWTTGLLLFFIPLIVSSIVASIRKRKFTEFAFPILITGVYLLIGLCFGLWHPYWVLFITIPIFYSIFAPLDKSMSLHRLNKWKAEGKIDVNFKEAKAGFFEDKIGDLTDEITDINEDIADAQEELADAISQEDADAVSRLSSKVERLKKKLEEKQAKLEKLKSFVK